MRNQGRAGTTVSGFAIASFYFGVTSILFPMLLIIVSSAIGEREDLDCIDLAAREALANAIFHGNHCDCDKTVEVEVGLNESCDLFVIIRDSGLGFDPGKIADPTAAENLLSDLGRGLFMIQQLMDEVRFKFDHGTEVRMIRRCRRLE